MLITNATIVTWESENRILENHAILIEGDRIKEIGTTKALTAKTTHLLSQIQKQNYIKTTNEPHTSN